MSRIAIIDSGVANLASIAGALRAVAANEGRVTDGRAVEVEVTREPWRVDSADYVVLPGVGHFEAGLRALRENGLDRSVTRAVEEGRPLLAVCLGFQMLCAASEESPGTPGLGIIPAFCRSLPDSVRLPHLGWNRVEPSTGCELLAPGSAAFANSYAVSEAPDGWAAALTNHGRPFVAALEQGRTLACQFHPELSGAWGSRLLARWLDGVRPTAEPHGVNGESVGLSRRIIPCLDVKHGRVVKGIRFQDLRDTGDPAERAALYEAQSADEIVLLDIAASPENQATSLATVRAVRERLRIPLSVGGGVRSADDARALLAAGADKVAINTAAVHRPELLAELASLFGRQCVVLAIDARRRPDSSRERETGWEVLVNGGRQPAGLETIEWMRRGVEAGCGEILLTSWDRDGTRQGCDEELLRAASGAVSVPVIASGGIGTREHFARAVQAGADAVLAASIFHDDEHSVGQVKAYLRDKGIPVRT